MHLNIFVKSQRRTDALQGAPSLVSVMFFSTSYSISAITCSQISTFESTSCPQRRIQKVVLVFPWREVNLSELLSGEGHNGVHAGRGAEGRHSLQVERLGKFVQGDLDFFATDRASSSIASRRIAYTYSWQLAR